MHILKMKKLIVERKESFSWLEFQFSVDFLSTNLGLTKQNANLIFNCIAIFDDSHQWKFLSNK